MLTADQADHGATRAGPAGAAGAVDVVLLVRGRVEVDDAGHVGDVDAAGGDVGGHEGLDLAPGEGLEGTLALRLAAVTVDGGRGHAGVGELLGEAVGPALGAGEHDGGTVAAHEAGGEVDLLVVRRVPEVMGRAVGALVDGLCLVAGGVLLVAADEHVDVVVEGGREQQGLAIGAHLVEQTLDLGQEAHVGHAIGLVDHDQVDLVEAHVAALHQVGEAARAGHGDVDAVAQGGELLAEADAAVEGGHGLLAQGGEGAQLALDLGGQLTGGGEHEGVRATGATLGRAHDEGDAEGERLAGARRGLAADVASGEGVGQGGGLHGEGRGDAALVEEGGEVGGDAELAEGDGHVGYSSSDARPVGHGVGQRGKGGDETRSAAFEVTGGPA